MALAKELQSEGSCGEHLIENEFENDDQQDNSNVPKSPARSRSEDENNAAFTKPSPKRTYSIESGEMDTYSPTNSSNASYSIRSLNSNTSVGEDMPRNAGEADTIDETVEEIIEDETEILSEMKEAKSLDDESSIDTNEDGKFASKAKAAKREQRKKRITEMDEHEEFRRKAMAKRNTRLGEGLPTEIELKESTAHSEFVFSCAGDDAIASIDNVLSTVFSEDAYHPSHYATTTIPGEINTKKSKKKKKSSKRKERKQKGSKHDASNSSDGSWWKLSLKNQIDDSSNTGTARKRKNPKVPEASNSYRSMESNASSISDLSSPKIRKNRKSKKVVENDDTIGSLGKDEMMNYTATRQNRKFEGSYSLRSIVEDAASEDIKDSSRQVNRAVTPTMTDSELMPSTVDAGEINEDKKVSGYVGMSEMIAEAVAKREARLASKNSSKLPFQSPAVTKESLSSRIRNKQSFPAPLTPPENDDDVSLSISDLAESPYIGPEKNEKMNSQNGSPKTMNEMIADAAAKRRERINSGNSPKLPFQSPAASKESLSSRLQKKNFASPFPTPILEHDESSNADENSDPEVNDITDVEAEDRNHDMTFADLAAQAAMERNERVEENNMKPRSFRKFEPVALNEEERREDRESHRKVFVPVVSEAAAYGRLVRLEEHVVEAQGDVIQHRDDRFNTWTGPKLRTDDGRSDALKAIQEAAAVGRIKCLAPEIVTNRSFDSNYSSDDHFDIENQIDEHGEKILRTNFLVDRHVKEILQGKKERMFIDSDAVGDRDDKIATYKDFDDVKLPTAILPTYDRIVKSRMNKSISNGADLAVRAMQLSEANLQEKNDDDVPQITLNRLRVIESISSAVAISASKRDARLQQARAMLKVTRKCMCPYCKDPNPYQTHKYKRLMYSEKFDDNADQSNYCEEVGEMIGTVSDAAKADKSSYYISPGGRKKKIIKIVRRKKRRPKGLQPEAPLTDTGEKKRVIDGTSLTPEEVGSLARQLQTQRLNGEKRGQAEVASNMTSEEFALISNVLRDKASTSLDPAPIKEEDVQTRSFSNDIVPSDQQFLEAAPDSNVHGLTTEEIRKLDNNLLVAPEHDEHGPDEEAHVLSTDQTDVVNEQSFSGAANESDSTRSQGEHLIFSASLPFVDLAGDTSSIPTASTQEVTLDTTTRHPAHVAAKHEKGENTSKTRKLKSTKKERTKSPVLPKSPSLRKPRKMISAPPAMSTSKKSTEEIASSDTKYLSPKGRQKKKNTRRRPKETLQSPAPKDTSNLPAPPSKTEEAKRKKTLRSRLMNLARSSSRPRNDPLSLSDHGSQIMKTGVRTSGRRERRSHSLEARQKPSHHGTRNQNDLVAVTSTADGKSPEKKSTNQSELQSQVLDTERSLGQKPTWAPERRSPSRTQSLPIGQKPKSFMDLNQDIEKPPTFRSLPTEKPNSTTSISARKKDPTGVSTTCSRSFEGQDEEPKTASTKLNVPLRQPSPSPHSQKKSLPQQPPKKETYPEMPPPKRNSIATTPIPPIPSFITISFDQDDCVDTKSTGPATSGAPESSKKSGKNQKRRTLGDKLDRERVKPRKCRSLDGLRVSKLYDNSGSERRKVRKPEKLRRSSIGKESRPDPPSSYPSPRRTPKRSRSLDRLAVTKLGARVKNNREEGSSEKKRDRSRERKTGKSRERKKSKEKKKERSKKDKSVERMRHKSTERKKAPRSRRWLLG